jgi:hypothetical protein
MSKKLENKNGRISETKTREFLLSKLFHWTILKGLRDEFLKTLTNVYLYFRAPMSKEEAKKFVKEVTGGKVRYMEVALKDKWAYINADPKLKSPIIVCHPDYRYRSVIAHELGHYVSSTKMHTFNYKSFNSLEGKRTISETYAMELEAWKEAEKLGGKNVEHRVLKRNSLKSYEQGLISEAESNKRLNPLKKNRLLQMQIGAISGLLTLIFLRNKKYSKLMKILITLVATSLGGFITRKITLIPTINKIQNG